VRALAFSLLCIVGGVVFTSPAFSAELPDWAKNQKHYARILNPIAGQVMAWIDQQQIDNQQAISLENADLLQIDNSNFRFELDTKHHAPKLYTIKTIRFDFVVNGSSIPRLATTQTNVVEQVSQNQAFPL